MILRKVIDKLILKCLMDTSKYPARIIMSSKTEKEFKAQFNLLDVSSGDFLSYAFEKKYRGVPIELDEKEESIRVEI